ncbi:MAG TPA: MBL fold metallo-hydrolase, partial [Syntrophomonadaceae bacterium]|nr:MBL fold metallo-hydrolase [Syntrophomonadaceae bacterium]
GHSVYSKLGQYTDIKDLDAVVISHYHPDHYADLYALSHAVRSAIFQGIRKEPLRVFLPSPSDAFNYFSGKNELKVGMMTDGGKNQVRGLELQYFKAEHSVPGFAVKVSSDHSSIFYSGDTVYNNKLAEASSAVDVLLIETTMVGAEQDFAQTRGHMTTRDVARWGRISHPGLLVATHFWDGYNPEQIHAELSETCRGKFILAHEGLSINI